MKSEQKKYWTAKAKQKVLQSEKKVLDYEHRMRALMEGAIADIEKDISKIYAKYAKDNAMTYSDALKYLTNDERREFQRDLNWYIEKASDPKYRQIYRQQLHSLSVRARVNRLEAMQASIKMESEKLYNALKKGSTQLFSDIYGDAYYRTAYDTFKGLGVGVSFSKPSMGAVDNLLKFPWDGENYSDRIWNKAEGFTRALDQAITRGLIQGQSVDRMSKALHEAGFGKEGNGGHLWQAKRVVRTESNFILNQATSDMYDALGVEEYEMLGTLDSRSCDWCGSLDGRRYRNADQKVGVNYPPLHPNCRCTTIPYIKDLDEEDIGERIARGKNGKTYKVPGDMTYEEWYRQYVDGQGKSGIIKNIEVPADAMKIKGFDQKIFDEVLDTIRDFEGKYDLRLDEITVKALSKAEKKVPFQFQASTKNGMGKMKLVINRDYTFGSGEFFTEKILNSYNDGRFASKNIGDLIRHELAHVLTFQDVPPNRWGALDSELREEFISGISRYADSTYDGAECIAEAFVRVWNGESIPKAAQNLLKTYVEKWRK